MSDPKSLTRNELAKFLPNQRAIRAFEELFKVVPAEVDNSGNEAKSAFTLAIQANSTAQEALTIAKGNKVLLWLSI